MTVELRPAALRSVTRGDGRSTAHSFSFGSHYDPDNLGFGALVAHNDDRLEPFRGYPLHRHSGLQIVTWVLAGRLRHVHLLDGVETVSEIGPGEAQVLATGDGVEHSECAGDEPVRLVQTWLADPSAGRPRYRHDRPALRPGGVTRIVGGGSALGWDLPVSFAIARLDRGTDVPLVPARWMHLFVADGSVTIDGTVAASGDASRVTDQGVDVSTDSGATVLVWSGS